MVGGYTLLWALEQQMLWEAFTILQRAIFEQTHIQCLLDASSCLLALPAPLGRTPKPALLVCFEFSSQR